MREPKPKPATETAKSKDQPPLLTVLEGGPEADSIGAETVAIEPAPPVLEGEPETPITPEAEAERLHRILWDHDELTILARDIARSIRKEGWRHVPEAGDRTGRSMLGDMLAAAQLKLPRERRRPRAGVAVMKPELWDAVEVALTSKSYLLPGEVEQDEPAAMEAKASNGPTIADLKDEEFFSLDDLPTETLLDALFSRLVKGVAAGETAQRKLVELEAKIRSEQGAILSRLAQLENRTTQTAEVKQRLPKVAILGCQLYEFHAIRKGAEEAGLKLDLRHYDQEAKPTPINADWALSLRFVNHPQLDQIAAAGIPSARSRTIMQGGTSKAIAQLLEWFPSS